jgi:fumarate reductase subunit D
VKKSNEPIWWSLFGAGGMLAALLLPALIVMTGLVLPFSEEDSYDRLRSLVSLWYVKLALFAIVSLPLFHWAHRFRYTVADLGIHGARGLIAVLCYGSSIVGTVIAGLVVFGL